MGYYFQTNITINKSSKSHRTPCSLALLLQACSGYPNPCELKQQGRPKPPSMPAKSVMLALWLWSGLLLLDLDVLREPREAFEDAYTCLSASSRRKWSVGCTSYLLRSSRSWARLSTRGSWLFGPGRALVLRRLVASLFITVSSNRHSRQIHAVRDSPPSTSCLFANTSNTTFLISRSCIMRPSSLFASSNLARSTESMTKISA